MLRVAAVAVVNDGRLLLVSKQAAPEVFYLPGGKPEPGESPEECVRREVREELGVELTALELDRTIHAAAALEEVPMAMEVFRGELVGEPTAAAEIALIVWHRPGDPLAGRIAPAIEALYASAPVWMRS